jgi:DNA-binding beta-propeller fold protein YncE
MKSSSFIAGITAICVLCGGASALAQKPAKRSAPPTARDVPARAPLFEVDPMWPKPMPNHYILGSAVGVAVDARDHVFVVNLTDSFNARTESGSGTNPKTGECCTPAPNVLEYDPSGALVGSWGGKGQGYDWPGDNAGIAIDAAGNLWIGGSGGADSQILEFSHDGKFIAQFGKAGIAPPARGGRGAAPDTAYQGVSPGRAGRGRGGRVVVPALPANSTSTETFGGPAGFSFDAAANEAFVADGYRNHRIAVIDMTTGAVKRYWGAYGDKPDDAAAAPYTPGGTPSKQFGAPVKCAELAKDGLLYVCDTQNDRIQVFKKDGSFVKEQLVAPNTRGMGSVWDIAFSSDPNQTYLYVADGMNMKVHVLDRQSLRELTSFGDGGRQPGQFYAVHSVATDSKGNLYTVETYEGKRLQKFIFKGVGPVPAAHRDVLWPTRAGAKK